MKKPQTDRFESVWDAIADTPEETANLRVRSELIAANGRTRVEAAAQCGLTYLRIRDQLRGRISRFSLDSLVKIAVALGQRVHVRLGAAQAK